MKRKPSTKRTKPEGNIGMYIGTSKEAVQEARAAILAIMVVQTEPEVKIEALKTLRKLCDVSNTSVSDCSFSMK